MSAITASAEITATSAPREVDTALAALWRELYRTRDMIAASANSAHSLIGERARYVSRSRREWPTSDADALAMLAAGIDAVEAHYAATGSYVGAPGPVQSYDVRAGQRILGHYAAETAALAELEAAIDTLEDIYRDRRWSRFFLVTSSAGHVHSSMNCSTCRITTTYGWLPRLSGKSEADAVAELGAVLCTVCFPSAPVENVGGKVTKAQAAKLAS